MTTLTSEASAQAAWATVLASPEAVARRDREGWLALFADDARLEDPVGSRPVVGRPALARFWDVFIAPQRAVRFTPRADVVRPDRVVRVVTIVTETPVGPEPLEVPAIIDYRLASGRIAQLRAYWEPWRTVAWHLARPRGVMSLARHGGRMVGGLGVGSALAFARALRPTAGARAGERAAEALAEAVRSPEAWRSWCAGVDVAVDGAGAERITDVETAWRGGLAGAPALKVALALRAGAEVAVHLTGGGRSAVALLAVEHGRVARLDWTWASRQPRDPRVPARAGRPSTRAPADGRSSSS
ncbi:MAG: nuclear transport factor 2 family protein [Sandaracinaceae bacterium]